MKNEKKIVKLYLKKHRRLVPSVSITASFRIVWYYIIIICCARSVLRVECSGVGLIGDVRAWSIIKII